VPEQLQVPRRPSYEELLVENAGLRAENGQLREELTAAVVRIGELEARLGMDVEELQQAAELGWADQTGAEVATGKVEAWSGPPERPDGIHPLAGRGSRP